jgi:hypothetical protein
MSVLNADISPSAVRSRSLTASSLADAVPFRGDFLNVVSRASGRLGLGRRRYLGFRRARVRQDEGRICTVSEFVQWTDEISRELSERPAPAALFSRFAMPIAPPNNCLPANILLDIDALSSDFINDAGKPFVTEDVCSDVTPVEGALDRFTHTFSISVDGADVNVGIGYEPDKERYILRSADLDEFTDAANPKVTLTKRLNQSQGFRVIPETPATVYAVRQFYDVDLRLKFPGLGSVLLDLLTPIPELATTTSEKGTASGTRRTWPAHSLFRVIDDGISPGQQPSSFGERFPVVVCEDLGQEFADFVTLNEERERVVFIHGKSDEDGTQLAASSLYDICAQAVKNLVYLRFGNQSIPGRAAKWNGNWSNGRFIVTNRIRAGHLDGQAVRTQLASMLRRPNVTREVWIVLGNILSRNSVEQALRSHNPPPHLLQSFYLLMSTYSACKSVGVDLRIFCHE